MQKTQLQHKQQVRISAKKMLRAIVALSIFFLLLTSVMGLAQKHRGINKRIEELHTEQENLKRKQAELDELNKDLETPEGKEYALRTKYNLVKPGEEMIVIARSQPEEQTAKEKRGIRRFWYLFLTALGVKKE